MVGPGQLQTSPFVHRAVTPAGVVATETVSDRSYLLQPGELRILDACRAARAADSLAADETAIVGRLLDRLLLIDETAWRSIGAATLGELDLEVAGSCNAECIFCPRDELRHGRGVGVMREETFARVLEIFARFLRFLVLAGMGEPTLHKALPRFVRALTERRIETALVTNGSLLTDALIDELLDAGVGSEQESFNGNQRASHEEHMLGLDFEATRQRVRSLLERARPRRIPVYISAVETSRNGAELAGFVDEWRALGAEAGVVRCHSRGGTIVELVPRRPAAAPARAPVAPRCGLFNSRSFVSWDGRVLACCHDVDGQTQLGDVRHDDAATLIARKLAVIEKREFYPVCHGCDEPARLRELEPRRIAGR